MTPTDTLPPEVIAVWALWLMGGLVLMLWFRRRSEAPPRPRFGERQDDTPSDPKQPLTR
jgi:hypothetical protein